MLVYFCVHFWLQLVSFNQTALLVTPKNKNANQWTEIWNSIILWGGWTHWGCLCRRAKHGTPLQPFLTNLTYAVLCTITSFEALIKGASSNRARKQKWKQRNKLFCFDPSLMCNTPLPTRHPPSPSSSQGLSLLTSYCHPSIWFPHYLTDPPHHQSNHVYGKQKIFRKCPCKTNYIDTFIKRMRWYGQY